MQRHDGRRGQIAAVRAIALIVPALGLAAKLLAAAALALSLGGCAALAPEEPAGRAQSPSEARPPAAAEEAVRSGRAGAGASATAARDEAFDGLDKDGDGYLTLPEAAADERLRRGFQAADRNGDFRLDPSEAARAR